MRPVPNEFPSVDPGVRKVTAFDLESNRRAARAAIKAEMAMFRGADWDLFSRTFHWFKHKQRMDAGAQEWFELTWREIHKQQYEPPSR